MDSKLEDLEQCKENVLPLKCGRKVSVLQSASAEGIRDQQKRAFETELRLYNGDDELDVWFRYVQWVEQNFPKGGQDGNLPILLKQCINRFKNYAKYKNDERYVQCWLKYGRYSPSILELFSQMDALEIGHKSAAFYEAWSWHLEQLGNFRKASQRLQEGIDHNAQPLEVLLEAQKQLSRKFVKQYSDSITESNEQQSDSRFVLGSLKPVGKRHAAPVNRGLSSKLDDRVLHTNCLKPTLPSQNGKFTVLLDSENLPPGVPRTLPNSAPSETWDSENICKPKPWNNMKHKSATSKSNSAPHKPEFTVHEDKSGPTEYGRRLVNSVTTVFRGSKAEIKLGYIEPDDPNKVYVCDFQKLYGGAEEFQPEEIAAARWYRDQKRKQDEQEVNQMKEELQKLKLLTAGITRPIQQNEIVKKQPLRSKADLQFSHKACSENVLRMQIETQSPRPDVSSPTRDVIALWNGTLSIPTGDDTPITLESSAQGSSKATFKDDEIKPTFQVYSDESGKPQVSQTDKNLVSTSKGLSHVNSKSRFKCQEKKPAFQVYSDENTKPKITNFEQNVVKTCHENRQQWQFGSNDDCKENSAPDDFVQNVHERASPHNILQPTDRPIAFGVEEEDDEDDDDLGVHPLPEEDCHTIGPLTTELHFALGAKLASTPLCTKLPSRSTVEDTLCAKENTEFKTPGATTRIKLSPISEASREISKSSSAYTTASSSSSSSLAHSTHRFTASAKSLLCTNMCIDPYDSELLCSLLLSANVEKRKGFLRIEGSAPKMQSGLILNYEEHRVNVLSHLAEGGEGKVFKAETIAGTNWPKEIAIKVYRPPSLWEFHMCSEVQTRIGFASGKPDVRQSFPDVLQTAVYNNCNHMISEFCPNGTLLNFTNLYRQQMQSIPESIALYFTWEILQIVSQLHACHFVHGDIKPDNFIVLTLPTDPKKLTFTNTFCLRLIDFGRAIDISKFPKGTTFNGSAKTDSFVCPEMRENRPWVFQPDYFGILGTIHVLLFPEYMEVNKINEMWVIKNKFKRYWQIDFWQRLFHTLLNVPDCDQLPDLGVFISELEQKIQKINSELDRDRYKLVHFVKSQAFFS